MYMHINYITKCWFHDTKTCCEDTLFKKLYSTNRKNYNPKKAAAFLDYLTKNGLSYSVLT